MRRWLWLPLVFAALGGCWVTGDEVQQKLDETLSESGAETGDTGVTTTQ